MVDEFKIRRDFIIDLVTKINGFNIKQPPMGAFYIFPNISELFGKTFKDVTVNDANDLSMLILEKAHVATVPGDAFGYPNCIRISYSASREQIEEAIKRIIILTEINKFFPKLNQEKKEKYNKLIQLYKYWNSKVNLISRKDIDNIEINHILHSLSIVKIVRFKDSTLVMDVGTGGGLPGIPLAIFFPKVNFTLIDSIGKKIKVVKSICSELSINNVNAVNDRVENHFDHYDFVLSRAVTRMDKFYKLVNKNFRSNSSNKIKNGIISLKGGTLYEELKDFNEKKIYDVNKYFNHEFFQTKKIIHIPFQK